jgi:hypothetical protein
VNYPTGSTASEQLKVTVRSESRKPMRFELQQVRSSLVALNRDFRKAQSTFLRLGAVSVPIATQLPRT